VRSLLRRHTLPRWPWWLAVLLLCGGAGPGASAQKAQPVPRFASLRADEVNLRTGPGERYPIDWVLVKKGLPVEIVQEFDVWRKIRDSQGSEGWVHQRMVAGTRSVIVAGVVRTLRADAAAAAPAVAHVEPGVVARLLECRGSWCRIETAGIKGWLGRSEVWGVYPDEVVP
jgi:SH3-like domain-containing protein